MYSMFVFGKCCWSDSLHQSSGTWQGRTQQTKKSHSHTTSTFLVKFICNPACSASVERIFPHNGLEWPNIRNKLSAEKAVFQS